MPCKQLGSRLLLLFLHGCGLFRCSALFFWDNGAIRVGYLWGRFLGFCVGRCSLFRRGGGRWRRYDRC